MDDFGNIFGGFSSASWGGEKGTARDSYLFLLKSVDGKNTPQKFRLREGAKWTENYHTQSGGPAFGYDVLFDDHDLFICSGCLSSRISMSCLFCYEPISNKMAKQSARDEISCLSRGTSFLVLDYEVFRVC